MQPTTDESRLVILDPSLKSYDGHFFHYDDVIVKEAGRRGVKCSIWAAAAVSQEVSGALDVVPCFRFGLESEGESTAALSAAFFDDLLKALQTVPAFADVTYFLHTTTATQIAPAIRFLDLQRNRAARLVILLRYSPAINPDNPDLAGVEAYRDALRSLMNPMISNRVRLVTDSEILAEEYRLLTNHPIEIVPIPHVNTRTPSVGRKGPRRLTYLGNARGSKGFQYLPYVISQIRPKLTNGEWIAELQSNVMFERDKESVYAVCALRNEPVVLFENELSPHDYEQLLDRASLVVIPYQLLWYHSQTSGVFAEAIGRGKPVVVPSGTWMARELGDSGAGIRFAPGDRVDLARAVRQAMDRIDDLDTGAAKLQARWTRMHNPAPFVSCILSSAAAS